MLLCEQNLHFSQAVADRAYIIEKGQIRFGGIDGRAGGRRFPPRTVSFGLSMHEFSHVVFWTAASRSLMSEPEARGPEDSDRKS